MHVAANVASFFLVVYMASVVGGCGYLLGRFIMRAESLKIRARSPTLATFPAVYAILVGGILIPLQELLKLLNKGYPCRLTLVQSWLFLPVWGAPFALRSLRVIIATSKQKYGFLLRKRTTLVMEAFVCMVAVCIVTALTQTIDPYDRGAGVVKGGPGGGECFMLMEWKFLLPFCVLQATIFGVLGDLLRNVNDLLNISSELRVNFVLYMVFGLPYFALQFYFRNRTDGKFPTTFQFLIAAMVVLALINTMWVSIGGLDNLLEFLGWKGVSSERSTIEPSTHGGSEADETEGKIRWPNAVASFTRDDLRRWKQHYKNIPSIMRNERMSAVLRDIASRSLCSESYDFLLRVSDYRRSTGNGAAPGLQHMLFIDICKAHVVVNSDQEINISHQQRTDILQFMDSRKFSSLTEAERVSVFVEAQREVSRMLELNLLPTLHGSSAFAETCVAVDVEEHVWHLEEEKYVVVVVNSADAVASRCGSPTPDPSRAANRRTTRRSVEGESNNHASEQYVNREDAGAGIGSGGGSIQISGRLSRMLLRPGLMESAVAAAAVGPPPPPPAQ